MFSVDVQSSELKKQTLFMRFAGGQWVVYNFFGSIFHKFQALFFSFCYLCVCEKETHSESAADHPTASVESQLRDGP